MELFIKIFRGLNCTVDDALEILLTKREDDDSGK